MAFERIARCSRAGNGTSVPLPVLQADGLDTTQLQQLCSAFQVKDLQAVQDVLNCLVLSEAAYRVLDQGPAQVPRILTERKQQFPTGLITLQSVQTSLPHVQHRYLLGSSSTALYVSFIGTKEARDLLADANILQGALWQDSTSPSPAAGGPAAHRGFMMRARSVPIQQLFLRARSQGKRLILCGHSLGGAVAELCMLRLLRQLPPADVEAGLAECFCFGTPALGNAALAALVHRSGWDRFFYSMTLPEDYVARILARYRPAEEEVQLEARDGVQESPSSVLSSTAGEKVLSGPASALLSISHQPFTAERGTSNGGPSPAGNPMPPGELFSDPPTQAGTQEGEEELASREPSGTGRQDGGPGGAWETSMPSLLPSSSLSGALWDRVRGLGSSLSSRLSETAAVLPSYVHFGRHHVAPTVGVAPAGIKLPEVTPGPQPYIAFSSHSMASYRNRALLMLASLGPLPLPSSATANSPVVMADDLAPALHAASAASRLPPLPPPPRIPTALAGEGSGSRFRLPWPWTSPATGQKKAAEHSVKLVVEVRGRGLASCTGVRVQAPSGTWLRTLVLQRPHLPSVADSLPSYSPSAAPPAQPMPWSSNVPNMLTHLRQSLWDRVRPVLDYGSPLWRASATPAAAAMEVMHVEVTVPISLARHVADGSGAAIGGAHGAPASEASGSFCLQLRSDFFAESLAIRLGLPAVWLVPLVPLAVADVATGFPVPSAAWGQSTIEQRVSNGVLYTLWPDRDAGAVLTSLLQAARLLRTVMRPKAASSGDKQREGPSSPAPSVAGASAAPPPPSERMQEQRGARRILDRLAAYRTGFSDVNAWHLLRYSGAPQLLFLVHDGSRTPPFRAEAARARLLQAAAQHVGARIAVGVAVQEGHSLEHSLPRVQHWYGTGQAVALPQPMQGPSGGFQTLLGTVYHHLSEVDPSFSKL